MFGEVSRDVPAVPAQGKGSAELRCISVHRQWDSSYPPDDHFTWLVKVTQPMEQEGYAGKL